MCRLKSGWFQRQSLLTCNCIRRSFKFNEVPMEEPSLFSDVTTNQLGEISDSNSSSFLFPVQDLALGGGPSGSKYRGVVRQPNGHWGAQIYANHKRFWLGTFESEKEAAMSYDSAAIKLRNVLTNRNFPWTEITIFELKFQDQFSTEKVLSMIKDGSYGVWFSDFLMTQDQHGQHSTALRDTLGVNLKHLFHKELTPSDVSKLNRLVIPKKYALKYFPNYDTHLIFFDRSMRSWKFRHCYWASSQSFVITTGWNRFTEEKGLRSRDRVIFSSYDYDYNDRKLFIDVEYSVDHVKDGPVIEDADALEMKIEPPIERAVSQCCNDVVMDENKESVAAIPCNEPNKVFRLSGVQIFLS